MRKSRTGSPPNLLRSEWPGVCVKRQPLYSSKEGPAPPAVSWYEDHLLWYYPEMQIEGWVQSGEDWQCLQVCEQLYGYTLYVHCQSGSFVHHPHTRIDTPGLFVHDGVYFTIHYMSPSRLCLLTLDQRPLMLGHTHNVEPCVELYLIHLIREGRRNVNLVWMI